MNEAERQRQAREALKNASEHGAIGDSFLAAKPGAARDGDWIERWGTLIGKGLAFVFAAVLLWSLLGRPSPF